MFDLLLTENYTGFWQNLAKKKRDKVSEIFME